MDLSKFAWKPIDLKHRLVFDSGNGELLGLVRELVIRFREDDDGIVTPFISVRFLDTEQPGQEYEIDYESDQVGLLDVNPYICVTSSELLEHLDRFRDDLRKGEELLGSNHSYVNEKRKRYESLVNDVRAIMCANRIFRLEDFQSLLAQHFLTGLA